MKNIIGAIEECTSTRIKGFICAPIDTKPPRLFIYLDNSEEGYARYTGEKQLTRPLSSHKCFEFHFEFSKALVQKSIVNVKIDATVDLQNSPYVYCPDSLSNVLKNTGEIKSALSQTFLSGTGLEIGALASPFPLKDGVSIKYVDRMDNAALRMQYPELNQTNLVNVDIIDDGEALSSIDTDSQDFIIACHFFEHAKDPVRFLLSSLRILKHGGILLLVVPDKRHTFDINRPLTSIEHLILDHENGHERQQNEHFQEIVYHQKQMQGEEALQEIERMSKSNYSYHWHVWTSNSFLQCISTLIERYNMSLEVIFFLKGKGEFYIVLMKA